ncbi:hypothetical protein ANCCAN_16202 [Ancylostoma caninum]|uniref:Uncharacterized protein n=1 Tax=Ancylostoma caninum TaxID=29170 RepID=A0A368G076_ANCCA|nr:hypothetical protein ANCCAN_16202 [Ancylostoma caninum]
MVFLRIWKRPAREWNLFSTDIRHFPVAQNGVSTHLEKAIEPVPPADLKLQSVGDTVALPRPIISKPYNSLEQNPFIKLASTFLRGATRQGDSFGSGGSSPSQRPSSELLPDFGGIRDFVPGANDNFGIRKGPG